MRWIPMWSLVGCGGGSFCDRQARYAEDCGVAVDDADLDECEELVADCDGKDQAILADYLDCLEDEGLYSCEPEAEEPDDDAVLGCVAQISGLSEPCLESFVTTEG